MAHLRAIGCGIAALGVAAACGWEPEHHRKLKAGMEACLAEVEAQLGIDRRRGLGDGERIEIGQTEAHKFRILGFAEKRVATWQRVEYAMSLSPKRKLYRELRKLPTMESCEELEQGTKLYVKLVREADNADWQRDPPLRMLPPE